MEFYKKIIKPRDENIILSEKQCKCASLQAITSEAIKENNKKRLRELVEEINGHLTDLRAIKADNVKNREKCDQLINNFEECLAQIVNSPLQNIIPQINDQLQEVENLSNIAIANNDCEELKKLSERMERNIAIIKEIPELKHAKDTDVTQERDNKLLGVLNKYMALLNRVLNDINVLKNAIDEGAENSKVSKLYEAEDKLKLFRQKRLNRQSKFINEQFKLAEQRNDGEHNNVPNKSLENSFSKINPIIKSSQSMQFNRAQKNSTNNMDVVGELSKQDEHQQQTKDLIISKREISLVRRDNFRKIDFNKSLTEQQIENARNHQLETPKSHLKTSESLKTPPRTSPTQIKKIFNSFNCVQNIQSSAIDKSAEDLLPSDCNSFFAAELKNFKLKNSGKTFGESEIRENYIKKLYEVSPPVVPKQKPIPTIRKFNSPVIEISAPEIPIDAEEAKEVKSDEQKEIKNSNRNSLDLEEIAIHPYSPNEGATITIKRNSSNNSTERSSSFSTFRASTESINSKDGVENPLYGYYFMPLNKNLPDLNFSTNNDTTLKPNETETSPKWSQINQLEPDITKLEYLIRKYKGLKRDKDYLTLDKALMKYHLKINDMITETSIDENAKENLLTRLTEAHQQLRYRVENNEKIMKQIFEDVVQIIGRKYQ